MLKSMRSTYIPKKIDQLIAIYWLTTPVLMVSVTEISLFIIRQCTICHTKSKILNLLKMYRPGILQLYVVSK